MQVYPTMHCCSHAKTLKKKGDDMKCIYDRNHMSELRINNTSESDPRSYKVT